MHQPHDNHCYHHYPYFDIDFMTTILQVFSVLFFYASDIMPHVIQSL